MKSLFVALATLVLCAPFAHAQEQPYRGLGAESVAKEVIAKFAPPPLDPAFTRRIELMLDVRTTGLGIPSPDGSALFFGWGITGSAQVFKLDRPQGFPIQLTGGEENTTLRAVTPDGRWLVLARDAGGQENPGLFLQPVGGGPLREIFQAPKVRASLGMVTDDSREIYYTANDVSPDTYSLYRYDIASGARSLVLSEKGAWFVADHRGSGPSLRLLLVKAPSSLASEVYELDPATRKLTPLLGVKEQVTYAVQYAAQEGELLVATDRFRDFDALYRWKIGSDTSAASFREVLAYPNAGIGGFRVDLPRRHVYVEVNDRGYTKLVVLDAATLSPVAMPLPADADHVVAGLSTPDGRFVTLGVSTPKAPRANYVWDWEKRALTQWLLPSSPEVDLSTFVAAQSVSYPAQDGTPIPAFVRVPKGCAADENPGADPCPVIVYFHGGPESQTRPGFSLYKQLMVDSGYIVFEPNVRGSGGYGRKWLDADNGPRRLDVIGDIRDAGLYVKQKFARNGKAPKVGVTGGSYGGYATLVAMTMFAGTYDAGVSVVGMSNLESFLRNTAAYRRSLRTSEYGDPERDAEALRKLSPVTYIDRVRDPILIIQGVNDPRVPVGEAVQMHEALARRGIDAPLLLFPDDGHGASRRSSAARQIGHTLRFFDEHLKKPRN
ncbi:MAG: prolyl oligopeptidase family serine peptidase [Burkholderiales bacterium]